MRYLNKEDLPVEVLERELPKDDSCRKYEMFYNEKVRTSGGFADAIFLGAVMVVCFMWGMLTIVLR